MISLFFDVTLGSKLGFVHGLASVFLVLKERLWLTDDLHDLLMECLLNHFMFLILSTTQWMLYIVFLHDLDEFSLA
jgi:hypothetical protein